MRHLRHLRPCFSSSVNTAEDAGDFPIAERRGKQSAWLSAQHYKKLGRSPNPLHNHNFTKGLII